MTLALLLLLESWPVAYAQRLLDGLHTYDILRYEATVEPGEDGVSVSCDLTFRVERAGPLRFFVAGGIDGLEATGAAASVDASLGKVLEVVAADVRDVPAILTLEPDPAPEPGTVLTIPLRYRWRPSAQGFAYAGRDRLQTHLAPFWLPSMANERFDAVVTVRTRAVALAPGAREQVPGGWRFRSEAPLQTVPVVVGAFRSVARGRFEVLLPEGVEADPGALLDDLDAVFAQLEAWYGPAAPGSFRLAVEPRPAPAPSFCAGSFAVVDRRFLPAAAGRPRWIRHLAHECAHVWWGHAVATPVVGGGGTWLREGLAEWSGCEVAGALLGAEVRDGLFRDAFRGYFRTLDLRRADGVIFANEPTLLDATFLDDPALPYLRGALVHRTLAARVGEHAFRERLAAFRRDAGERFVTAADYARALGQAEAVAYYAGTSRLPDFELADVDAAAGTAVVRCRDPLWPAGPVPCRVETDGGSREVPVEVRGGSGTLRWTGAASRIEIDPERLTLDPLRSNNLWPP